MKLRTDLLLLLPLASLFTCGAGESGPVQDASPIPAVDERFVTHWSDGLAEVNTYTFQQARYGQLREGKSVLVFVTEDFGVRTHVKWEGSDAEHTMVLKLNRLDRFTTGLYDYHLMTSVFDPLDMRFGGHAMKVTTTVQDWCGHVFVQLDHGTEGYHLVSRSYFEAEGEVDRMLGQADLEDALWTRLRRSGPKELRQGELRMVPSLTYLRLMHKETRPYSARLKVNEQINGTAVLELTYPELERTLRITCSLDFPWQVTGWTETRPDGFGVAPGFLETRATLDHSERLAYWNMNHPADSTVRRRLGL